MTLAALVDAGLSREWLAELPARAGFPSVTARIERVERATVMATKVAFEIPNAGGRPDGQPGGRSHGRTIEELIDVVRRAEISDGVRSTAIRAFELLGEAEGRVHGVAPNRVHLHEVGAVDAVLDIVGAIEGFEQLGVEAVYNLPAAVGSGWVEAEHGKLPVPAPATAYLLEGIELHHGETVTGEATTPTGAVLLRVLSQGAPPQRWRLVSSAWGAGDRNPHSYPNALRLMIGEAAGEAGVVEVIATDIDDLAPEYLEPLRGALFDAGALDCVVWPAHGKKGRVSVRLEVLVAPEAADRVIGTLFSHSTTAGVRRWPAARSTLARRELVVELDSAVRVRIKVWDGPFGTRVKSEYDDVVAAAGLLGRPALEVAREAERRAEAILRDGEPSPQNP
ncbi:MAG: nickel pincer cofactor biosynthesis protein LarC [Gemmatimonadales bacterium]|nr:nickel pincer cofactor biosynthesis protein LarC [Gemmatimonadales bacterium]